MAEAILANSVQNTVVDTIESFYTSPSTPGAGGTRVTAFTTSNNGAASASYKAYIFDASAAALPAIVTQKIVVKDRFDLGPSIVGQLIPPGGTLRMESSSLSTLSFRVTGNEL